MSELETVLTRDSSSGRIHRRTVVEGGLATLEGDNLDDAGAYEVITLDQLADAEPDQLCERCFPPDAT